MKTLSLFLKTSIILITGIGLLSFCIAKEDDEKGDERKDKEKIVKKEVKIGRDKNKVENKDSNVKKERGLKKKDPFEYSEKDGESAEKESKKDKPEQKQPLVQKGSVWEQIPPEAKEHIEIALDKLRASGRGDLANIIARKLKESPQQFQQMPLQQPLLQPMQPGIQPPLPQQPFQPLPPGMRMRIMPQMNEMKEEMGRLKRQIDALSEQLDAIRTEIRRLNREK